MEEILVKKYGSLRAELQKNRLSEEAEVNVFFLDRLRRDSPFHASVRIPHLPPLRTPAFCFSVAPRPNTNSPFPLSPFTFYTKNKHTLHEVEMIEEINKIF